MKSNINSFGLISDIVVVMESVEQLDLTSIESKKQAMMLIKKLLGNEQYSETKDIISSLIDFLCWITKNRKQLHLNEKNLIKCLTSCCK